jgi:hypothetical protein
VRQPAVFNPKPTRDSCQHMRYAKEQAAWTARCTYKSTKWITVMIADTSVSRNRLVGRQ